MRDDSLGLWWSDLPAVRGKRGPRERGPMPPIPETGWTPPSEFPNLSAAKVIGLDTETYDPELQQAGPGWARGKGHIIGVSLAVQDGTSWYFPVRHETQTEMNIDPEQVFSYMRHTLADNRPKVGANLIYDIGWLLEENVKVGGRLYDVQFAEALLDSETPHVALEDLAQRYLNTGKESSELYDWLADWCGGTANGRQRANMHLSPPSLAGPYAEADAALPIRILEKQWSAMEIRGVVDLFNMECGLIPLLVAMRRKGAPINLEKAEQAYETLGGNLETIQSRMQKLVGQPVNPNAQASIKSAFDKLDIPLPRKKHKKTGKEVISFDAERLESVAHPLAEVILNYRRTAKIRDTFIKSYLIDKHVNSRIHCSFHPLKGMLGGARSGRFASSGPNLQNIPIRTEEGKLIREMFAPLMPGGRWRKADFSQIEYRLLAHHAVGKGSEELRRAYNENPDIDYHNHIIDLVFKMTGIKLERRPAKNINFGLIYGMSQPVMAASLKLSKKAGSDLFKNYHIAAPFARDTMDQAASEVHRLGYVQTLMGRRSDFNSWSPKRYEANVQPLGYNSACLKWGMYNIERASTHKALNRKLQGGAADIMKKSMLTAYEAGLFEDDACGMPCLTVHDELDFEDYTDPDNPAWAEFKHVMENSVPGLRVPIRIDSSIGPNWGAAD